MLMQLLETSGYLDMENTTEYFPLLFCHYRPSIFVTESFAATLLLAPLVTAQCDVLHGHGPGICRLKGINGVLGLEVISHVTPTRKKPIKFSLDVNCL